MHAWISSYHIGSSLHGKFPDQWTLMLFPTSGNHIRKVELCLNQSFFGFWSSVKISIHSLKEIYTMELIKTLVILTNQSFLYHPLEFRVMSLWGQSTLANVGAVKQPPACQLYYSTVLSYLFIGVKGDLVIIVINQAQTIDQDGLTKDC